MRLGGEHLVLLYLGTLLAGFGIAVGGTIAPGIVKEYFPEHVGLVTAGYMLAMMGGAAAASAVSVPLAERAGLVAGVAGVVDGAGRRRDRARLAGGPACGSPPDGVGRWPPSSVCRCRGGTPPRGWWRRTSRCSRGSSTAS